MKTRLPFTGLRSDLPVTIYRSRLPHWRQDGATYFVTFRLGDSIPSHILSRWAEERSAWMKAHGLCPDKSSASTWSERYAQVPEEVRHAFERREARQLLLELDRCHGSCRLRDPVIRKTVCDAMVFFDGSRLQSGDLIIMPNHVHWIVRPLDLHRLESLLGSVKRYSSRSLGLSPFWQRESYDHLIRNRHELARIRRYIEQNAVHAKLGVNEYTYMRADWLDDAAAVCP